MFDYDVCILMFYFLELFLLEYITLTAAKKKTALIFEKQRWGRLRGGYRAVTYRNTRECSRRLSLDVRTVEKYSKIFF
jgi:hypothetical protein